MKTEKKNFEKVLGTIGQLKKMSGYTTIYIGNLRYTRNEYDLKDLFQNFGEVTYVKLMMDKETNKSLGYAFIQMPKLEEAMLAIDQLDGTILDGRTIKVSISKEQGQVVSTVAKVARRMTEESPKEEVVKSNKRRRDKGLKLLFNHKQI
jgi:RNA recognition motif-containing protein